MIEDSGSECEDEEGFEVVWALEFDVAASAVVTKEAVGNGHADGEDLYECQLRFPNQGDEVGCVIYIPMLRKSTRRPIPSFS